MRKSLRFPYGSRLPAHLSPLLPDTMFPPTRDPGSPIHPLFPPPSPFPRDPTRYLLPDHQYMPNQPSESREDNEVNEMKNMTPSYVINAPEDKRFFAINGEVYANLKQLHAGLLMMKDEHFRHHVSQEKNDVKAWIAGVFADHSLAKDISRVRSRSLTAYKVGQRVRQLRMRKKK